MFQLKTFKTVKLNSVNARSEKHGPDELAPAVDLSFTIESSNEILGAFHPDLLKTLYCKIDPPADGAQAALDGVEAVSDLPNLRFAFLGSPIKWEREQTGCMLTLDYGLGGKQSNIVLVPCNVNNYQITPHEGGTVEIKFRVQCNSGLSERILGKLALLIQHEVPIMLTEPEVVEDKQANLSDILPGDTTPTPPLTATDVFLTQAEIDAKKA
jgi:hypothetical protein